MVTISTDNYPDQEITSTLNGQPVKIRLRYDAVVDDWYFSLYTQSDQVLCLNRRIKSGFPVFGGILIEGFDGEFMAVPISAPEEDLGKEPWGNTHTLVSYLEGELNGSE